MHDESESNSVDREWMKKVDEDCTGSNGFGYHRSDQWGTELSGSGFGIVIANQHFS
jgi:hypothetical protein